METLETMVFRTNMKKKASMAKANIISFIIAFVYVALGTIVIFSMYPDDPFSDKHFMLGLILTLPVSFFGFGYRYSNADQNISTVLIIQTISLVLLFLLLRKSFYDYYEKRRLKRRHQYLDQNQSTDEQL